MDPAMAGPRRCREVVVDVEMKSRFELCTPNFELRRTDVFRDLSLTETRTHHVTCLADRSRACPSTKLVFLLHSTAYHAIRNPDVPAATTGEGEPLGAWSGTVLHCLSVTLSLPLTHLLLAMQIFKLPSESLRLLISMVLCLHSMATSERLDLQLEEPGDSPLCDQIIAILSKTLQVNPDISLEEAVEQITSLLPQEKPYST